MNGIQEARGSNPLISTKYIRSARILMRLGRILLFSKIL